MNSQDEINAFRNRLQIKARGNDVPNPAATFVDMDIHPDLKPIIIGNIEESAWKDPTPIQMQAITVMLKGEPCRCRLYVTSYMQSAVAITSAQMQTFTSSSS